MDELKVKGSEEEKLMTLTQEQRDLLVSIFDNKSQTLTIEFLVEVFEGLGYTEQGGSTIIKQCLDEGIAYVDMIRNRGRDVFIGLTDFGESIWEDIQ